MKYLVILILFNSCTLIGQKVSTVTIVVKSNSAVTIDSIFITGNVSEFGIWNPAAVPLTKVSDTVWTKSFDFKKGELLEFKFTRGSWQTEALNENNMVPDNHTLKVSTDTTLIFDVYQWQDQLEVGDKPIFEGQITGQVFYHKNFVFEGIEPRDIIVWVPPGYNELNSERYPVLYMHDGQNIFDPKTSAFGIDWQVDETATEFILEDQIEPLIIVGIYNTINRSSEYNESDLGKIYCEFITNQLKPFIDKNYKTKPGRDNTFTGGSSAGGLISFILLWENPDVFSGAICISPAFKINEIDYVNNVEEFSGDKKPIRIYIDNGGVGLEEKLQPGIDEMAITLMNKGFILEEDLFVYYYKTAKHSEKYWAERFWKPLKIFLGK
ncbi:MAG: histidine kinase [Ignavibacteriae bacterium]|nr:histidine kinase [Ignavibacteriota bacterium]NOG99040.1 histidine kinase [Ignavibacteriota bacterium]